MSEDLKNLRSICPKLNDYALDLAREVGNSVESQFQPAHKNEVIITEADDGGAVLSFENETTNRELVLTVSDDGEYRFFIANEFSSGRKARRYAGVIALRTAYDVLGRWLSTNDAFPDDVSIVVG